MASIHDINTTLDALVKVLTEYRCVIDEGVKKMEHQMETLQSERLELLKTKAKKVREELSDIDKADLKMDCS